MNFFNEIKDWTTFEDLILDELELQEYKEYARDQQLLLEVSDYES